MRDPDGEVHADVGESGLLTEARIAISSNLGAIEAADPDDFNGVYGNYLAAGGVFDEYASQLYASSRDLGLLDLTSTDDVVRLYLELKRLVMRDITIRPNIEAMKDEHPEWASVVEGITASQIDAASMATLIANFKKNPMGFTYSGASKAWALAGDCGSIVRTFMEIANDALGVDPKVTSQFHNGPPGWFVPAGFSNIASNKIPSVAGGSWYSKASHVWAEWGGTVYDVLFGEVGQNGSLPAEGKYVLEKKTRLWHFKVGSQWYRASSLPNMYVKTEAPK